MNNMINPKVASRRISLLSIVLSTFLSVAFLASQVRGETTAPVPEPLPTMEPSESAPSAVEEPAPVPELSEPVPPEVAEPAAAPISPSARVSGTIWRSKPGIVFLQTPIGPLSLSSKTTLRDIRGSQTITLWIHGSTTVIDIREKGTGALVHRYITGMPNFTSPEKTSLTFWTPEEQQSFMLGAFAAKIAGRPDHQPFTIEVDKSGVIRGLHDVQFDLQVNQIPRTSSQLHLLLNGTVSKLKSNYVFLKTPLGIVTVSGKAGVRNAKVGQEMSVWVHERHVAIDLYQNGVATPSRRFLSGPLTYSSGKPDRLIMQTAEGEQSVSLTHRPAALASLKEGMPVTVELDQQGTLVDVRLVN
ncbi:MAG: exported protein of unknown function [Nitrospira sp.]|jgi:hypothetical protein|nr:exported protein of unknown function [Nitrospira sp.]